MLRFCLVTAAVLMAAPAYAEGQQEFMLHNQLDKPIVHIYMSEAGNPSWEDDVLGGETLDVQDSTKVTFAGYKDAACRFDFKFETADHQAWVVRNLDVCATADLTLKRRDGRIVYHAE